MGNSLHRAGAANVKLLSAADLSAFAEFMQSEVSACLVITIETGGKIRRCNTFMVGIFIVSPQNKIGSFLV